MVRLHVVTWPSAEARLALAALARPPTPGVVWASPELLMVKLRPLGHVPEELWAPLEDSLVAALDGVPAARCILGPTTRRWSEALIAPVTGLDDLAAEVFEATEPLVPVTHPQPFQANVVLARGNVPRELAGARLDAAWTATSVAVVADRSSPRGPRFEEVAMVPLVAA